MSALTAAERGDLAEEMLPVAARLATLVHGDGGPEDIHQALGALDGREKDALIVVLAGLADPDRPLAALLGWLDFDETGQPAQPDHDDRTTLRDVAEAHDREQAVDPDLVDEVAVARYLAGHQMQLSKQDRIAAIVTGLGRGMDWHDFDRLSGVSKGSTYQFFRRERKAAAARGEVLQAPTRAATVLTEPDVVRMRERHAAGEDMILLALVFGVSQKTVGEIVTGVAWARAGGPVREPRRRGVLSKKEMESAA